jgi:predicted small metal-binding protein
MARQVTCECGFVARGETEDEVVRLVEDHLRSDHPQFFAEVKREDIVSWIEVVE